MRALTIEAGQLVGAQGLYNALSEFNPELSGDDSEVTTPVELGNDDVRILAVLEAIQAHVTARDDGPARVEIQGLHYTFHSQ
jgi:hypothetical protein